MIDRDRLCPGCMTEQDRSSPCPDCGYDGSESRHSLALPAGAFLAERFHIGRVLGKPGGYGIAYLAFDTVLESTVAIKEFLPPTLAGRTKDGTGVSTHSESEAGHFEEALAEFVREARILVKFDHPNIARVRDFFEANHTAYLVMDYYRGESLQEYLVRQTKTLNPEHALALLGPILDGLEAMHAAGYLHRDIKPSNIYLTEENRPILLDFGAARHSLGDATQSLSVVISRSFAPYEQHLRRSRQGPWTDIYAFAATLYYTLTAVRPPDALERKEHDELIPPAEINPHVDGTFQRAVLSALAVEPEDRPKSIAEFRAMLAGTRAAASVAPRPSPEAGDRSVEQERRRTALVWLVAALLSLAIAAYVLTSKDTGPAELPELAEPPAALDRPPPAPSGQGLPASDPVSGFAPRDRSPIAPDRSSNVEQPLPAVRQAPDGLPEAIDPAVRPEASTGATFRAIVPPPPSTSPGVEPERRPRNSERPVGPPPGGLRRPVPPAAAFEACNNKSPDARCNVVAPHGVLDGLCRQLPEGLACVPTSHRPPPR